MDQEDFDNLRAGDVVEFIDGATDHHDGKIPVGKMGLVTCNKRGASGAFACVMMPEHRGKVLNLNDIKNFNIPDEYVNEYTCVFEKHHIKKAKYQLHVGDRVLVKYPDKEEFETEVISVYDSWYWPIILIPDRFSCGTKVYDYIGKKCRIDKKYIGKSAEYIDRVTFIKVLSEQNIVKGEDLKLTNDDENMKIARWMIGADRYSDKNYDRPANSPWKFL